MKLSATPRAIHITAALLLLLMAILAGGAARRESVTIDEVPHLGAGVSYLQKLDMRLNEEHPPLAKVLAALPLVLRGVHADYSNESWTFSGKMFNQFLGEWVFGHWVLMRWNDPVTTLFWARLPMLLITLLLGYVLYVYGSRLGGPWGGLLALVAYVTMPAFLTFGPLVLTDTVITLFFVLTMWTFADLWRAPSLRTVLPFGFALAGALLSKFSSGLLFFFFAIFILLLRWRPLADVPAGKTERRAWRRRRWWNLIEGTALAAALVYTFYLALSWNESTDSLQLLHVAASPALRRALMPPWIYLRGLIGFALTSSRGTFILGHAYPHGVWFYFPILFFLKSQLAFILLLLLTLVVWMIAKRRLVQLRAVPTDLQLHWRALWVLLLVYIGACMLSRLDMSVRHFSVPLALLALLLAPLPHMLQALQRSGWRPAGAGIWLTFALCVICLITAVRTYPYYFPFVSSFGMGRPAYSLMNDSNVDWNQSLPDVERFVQQRGLTHVLIDEYGFSEPSVYVPQGQFWNCQEPATADGGQWAVVSADMIEESHNCLWLLHYPHESLAAGSMYVFQLPAIIPPAGSAAGPPLPADYHSFGGIPGKFDWRFIFLSCTRDPQKLQPTLDMLQSTFASSNQRQR